MRLTGTDSIIVTVYDDWGKIISVTGTQSATIGAANTSATEATTTIPKQNCIISKADTTIPSGAE